MHETDDLVQEVIARTLSRLDSFDYRGAGSFWNYLRTIGVHYVGEIVRRREETSRPRSLSGTTLDVVDLAANPVAEVLANERYFAFESALQTLSSVHRDAVLMRLELDLAYETIATECGFPSADAARMAVNRAMSRLVEHLSHGGHTD